ncbi:hypothetical protein ACLMJK_000107 [Lecanora helva]
MGNRSIMKVTECAEAWDGEGDDFKFDHWAIVLTNGTEMFRSRNNSRDDGELALNQEIDIAELECPIHQILPEDMWPPFEEGLLVAPQPTPDEVFIKKRVLVTFDPQEKGPKTVRPCDHLLHEAKMCEILRKKPHPNIASYFGVIEDDGLIKALCFAKYEETLGDRMRDLDRPLNVLEFMEGVKNGLDHLHSLGLNHNDVNPRNIMLDKQDVPVIIDFDCCEWEGNEAQGCGTLMWIPDDKGFQLSERKNDDFGWEAVRNALLTSYNAG